MGLASGLAVAGDDAEPRPKTERNHSPKVLGLAGALLGTWSPARAAASTSGLEPYATCRSGSSGVAGSPAAGALVFVGSTSGGREMDGKGSGVGSKAPAGISATVPSWRGASSTVGGARVNPLTTTDTAAIRQSTLARAPTAINGELRWLTRRVSSDFIAI